MTVAHQAARPARADSIFFPTMALAMAAVVFAGFAPTWFLRAYFQPPEALSPLRIIHGIAFTLWVMLFVAQTSLVAANRRDIHRKLGWWGAGLAGVMLILGWMLAANKLREGATPIPDISPAVFFSLPAAGLVAFALLVVLGVLNRKRSDHHKRYLLVATMVLLAPAIGRLPHIGLPPVFFALTDIFLLALIAYDFYQRGKLHRATWIGGAVLIASQAFPLTIGMTPQWQAFANSLV